MNVRPSKITLVLLTSLLTGCAEKYELDRQMEVLCKKDGGVKIYEVVSLPDNMFDQFGQPHFSGEWNVRKLKNGEILKREIGNAYTFIEEITVLKNGDPLKGQGYLSQTHYKIQRNDDKKILAEAIQYLRAGGDFWAPGHHSSASCPNEPINISEKVFIKNH